ncbi:MAG TPA: methyl-accepting chemotaxis protein [Gemmatimonadaceae bacterium]|nr:methyl-accepting chemotaxis protein [Gemmatimonadaceae bacterium]
MSRTQNLPADPDLLEGEDKRTFHTRLVLGVGAVSLVALSLIAWPVARWIGKDERARVDHQLSDAVARAALRVDRYLGDHERLVSVLASSPAIVDAARAATAYSRREGLPGRSVAELEARFDASRSLELDTRLRAYLRQLRSTGDIAEIIVTDVHGFNAVTTGRTSDFVQADEDWWQTAMRDGAIVTEASYDSSARSVSISMTGVIRESADGPPLGALKVVFGLRGVDQELMRVAADGGFRIELLESQGLVLAASGSAARMRPLEGLHGLESRASGVMTLRSADDLERAAVSLANNGKWRVVGHLSESLAYARWNRIQLVALGLTVLLFLFILGSMAFLNSFVARRVSEPASALATTAEQVASGDLSTPVYASEESDEIGRLSRAVDTMVVELRRLVSAIRAAAHETAAMAAEITAGSEQMSASASEMAQTSNDLSHQSSEMAQTTQRLAADAARLMEISKRLTAGARDGVERNLRLRQLASENRQRLDEGSTALTTLLADAQAGAAASDALVRASEEIRAFVTLVRRLAKQSKLLALNASMEAARAGEHGEGFAVVASEIRKLAATSTDASERTEAIVADVLARVEESRASSQRTMQTATEVQAATQHAMASFEQIERAVAEAEEWAATIEQSVSESNTLVGEMTARIDAIARGTDAFASAMEQVAASSQEQSASTQEIAGAASMLANASQQLSRLVATFRTDRETSSLAELLAKADPGEHAVDTVSGAPQPVDV